MAKWKQVLTLFWWDFTRPLRRYFQPRKHKVFAEQESAKAIADSWTWRPEFSDEFVWGIILDENQGKGKPNWTCLR